MTIPLIGRSRGVRALIVSGAVIAGALLLEGTPAFLVAYGQSAGPTPHATVAPVAVPVGATVAVKVNLPARMPATGAGGGQ